MHDSPWFEIVKWATTVAAMVGVVLNIKRDHRCYVIWMFTNVLWVGIDLYHGIWSQAVLQFFYFWLSVWGFRTWRRQHHESIMER